MALAGLVADYTDSSEDEEETGVDVATVSRKISQTSADFFDAANANSSDSSQSDDEIPVKSDTFSECNQTVLPNPLADSSSSHIPSALSMLSGSKGTVFGNRFADQEKAELAIFEKHVKMTEDHTSSRPPCFKFKRGACRKGNGCRFSHDLGFQAPNRSEDAESSTASAEPDDADNSSQISSQSTKKRVGVTNTLMPAKKAKQALYGQRAKERPWTMHH